MTTGGPPPDPVMRAMGGWQGARVLMTANRMGIFGVVGDEALAADEIAERCRSHPRSMALLLNACVALGFLEKRGDRYANSPAALEALVPGRPGYMGDSIKHQEWLWNVWTNLEEAVRTNRPVRGLARAPVGADPREFSLAMHNRAMRNGPLLAEALDLSGRRRLLDCGGGVGTYSIFLARRYPDLRAVVFDLPDTAKLAEEVIAEFGLSDRVTTRGGNYFEDDPGEGYDVVLLSAVLHSMAPENCSRLLTRCHRALVNSGLVIVHEGLVDAEGTSPTQGVLFSLNMLVNTDGGRSYSEQEIVTLMREAGFVPRETKTLPQPFASSLVIGEKP